VRRRAHLANLPTADVEENAAIVNALQRHATIIVQKSLREGFGLTVTEAMWKGRPIVASAVGGIADQIENGVDGLLLENPRDLDAFAGAIRLLRSAPDHAQALGDHAAIRAREQFLGLRHLIDYSSLLERIDAVSTR
jgi:trehalose synthase